MDKISIGKIVKSAVTTSVKVVASGIVGIGLLIEAGKRRANK